MPGYVPRSDKCTKITVRAYIIISVKLSASGSTYAPFGRNPAVAGKGRGGWPGKFLIFIVLRDDKSIPDPWSEGTIKDNPQRPRARARSVLLPDESCDSAARIHFREAITLRKTIVNFSFLSSNHRRYRLECTTRDTSSWIRNDGFIASISLNVSFGLIASNLIELNWVKKYEEKLIIYNLHIKEYQISCSIPDVRN